MGITTAAVLALLAQYPPVDGWYTRTEAHPVFAELDPWLDNTWRDSGRAFFNNWLGLVYQLTDVDRKIPFPPHIDPNDPLGLNAKEAADRV